MSVPAFLAVSLALMLAVSTGLVLWQPGAAALGSRDHLLVLAGGSFMVMADSLALGLVRRALARREAGLPTMVVVRPASLPAPVLLVSLAMAPAPSIFAFAIWFVLFQPKF